MKQFKSIDEQIKDESEAFNNKRYDGPPLPEDIMFLFIKGSMQTAPSDPYWMREMVKKEAWELTWKEVGIIMNFLKKLPYSFFFEDIHDGIEFHIKLMELTVKYNEVMSELAAELEAKRDRLEKISGGSNGIIKSLKN